MCGFSGCYSHNKKLKKNFNPIPLNHRGPDDFKLFKNNFVHLNFFRLKILGGSWYTTNDIRKQKVVDGI